MKIKKIFALGLSATLMLSSVIANAELTVKDDVDLGDKVVVTLPTTEELKLRRPDVTVIATKLETQDDVLAATTKAWSLKHKIDKYDVYKLTFTASNLGGLYNGMDTNYEGAQAGLGLFKVELGTTALKEFYVDSTSIVGGNLAANQDVDAFKISYNISNTKNPYPYYDDKGSAMYMENGSIDMSAVVAIGVGETLTINNIKGQIAYTVNMVNTEATLGNVQDTLVIGKAAPVETCATLNVDLAGKFDNGYVWTADLTKGTKDIASFKAKFEAGEAVAERQIKNIADLTSKFDGEGKVSFNIGLETKKELTKATFTVNDGDDHAVEAPVK